MLLLYKRRKILIYILAGAFGISSCKKIIDIDAPVTSVNQANVYNNDATAISVLTAIYANMSNGAITGSGFTGTAGLSLLSGLSADELTLYSGVADNELIAYYRNALVANSTQNYGSELWEGAGSPGLYYYIFICNASIEGLTKSTTLTPSVRQQLLGEAKFMRAFFYFYLVNCFGDVPLALTTDPAVNSTLPRAPREKIYQQIVVDLKDAQNLLSSTYLSGNLLNYSNTPERVRPTKWAAIALLARTYLYTGDYVDAEEQSTIVINNTAYYSMVSLSNVFLKNSYEAIWQIQPVRTARNTEDAFTFILPSTGPSEDANPVYLSPQLLGSFEVGDQRQENGNWINSITVNGGTYYYPYKYKATTVSGTVTEYLMMLRLAEQYLIRAEARAQQNNISGAQSDLNAVRIRAGLTATTANDKTSLLAGILHERQVELFTELGQRWFDLKRTNTIDAVMGGVTPAKGGGAWVTTDQLYPVPFADISKNTKLIQNSGY